MKFQQELLETVVRRALDEDGAGDDLTARVLVPRDALGSGRIGVKEGGIVAGLEVAQCVFACLDKAVHLRPLVRDGDRVRAGDVIVHISGPAQSILTGERTALNFLQRMSGIATLTRRFVDAIHGTGAVILDTRKTAPGLRLLDKLAVKIGGGENHRFGLHDMVMIKENHIVMTGSITEAVKRIRSQKLNGILVEVEVKNIAELRETLELPVDRILLDNMNLNEMKQAVLLTNHRIPLEASGSMTLENVADVAATGVDYISVGKLTHSVKALDMSLLFEEQRKSGQ